MTNNKTALIVGASGLIGSELLKILLSDKSYTKVIALVRKPLQVHHPNLEQKLIDFDQLESLAIDIRVDDVFSCLGTTIKKAKTQDAMRKIDVEYPLQVARKMKKLGAKQFLFVSALHANRNSTIFYSKMKGELEEEVSELGFQSVSIFRPSLLLGNRQEFRLGEKMAEVFYSVFPFLFIGPFRKYKAIQAQAVAAGMLYSAQLHHSGINIYQSDQIETIAANSKSI